MLKKTEKEPLTTPHQYYHHYTRLHSIKQQHRKQVNTTEKMQKQTANTSSIKTHLISHLQWHGRCTRHSIRSQHHHTFPRWRQLWLQHHQPSMNLLHTHVTSENMQNNTFKTIIHHSSNDTQDQHSTADSELPVSDTETESSYTLQTENANLTYIIGPSTCNQPESNTKEPYTSHSQFHRATRTIYNHIRRWNHLNTSH